MEFQLAQRDLAMLECYPNLPIIDATDRRRFKHCHRQWNLQSPLRQGLRPKLPAPPLLFGQLIHAALDTCYKAEPYGYQRVVDQFEQECRQEIDHIRATYKPWPDEQRRYDELLGLGKAMLVEYAQWAPALDDFTVVQTEHAGFVPICTESGVAIGLCYFRTDGVVRDDRGRLWVLEHKTCRRWWSEPMLALDEQLTQYMWCEQQWFGQPMAGVLMNFLLKEPVKDPTRLKSGRLSLDRRKLAYVTADRFMDALPDDVDEWSPDEAEVFSWLDAREHPTLRRVLVTRSNYAIAQQRTRLTAELTDMLRTGCDPYPSPSFTCGSCPVYVLCQQIEHGDDWEFTRDQLFEHATPMWQMGVHAQSRDEGQDE